MRSRATGSRPPAASRTRQSAAAATRAVAARPGQRHAVPARAQLTRCRRPSRAPWAGAAAPTARRPSVRRGGGHDSLDGFRHAVATSRTAATPWTRGAASFAATRGRPPGKPRALADARERAVEIKARTRAASACRHTRHAAACGALIHPCNTTVLATGCGSTENAQNGVPRYRRRSTCEPATHHQRRE
jgi:hypothetical protein